MSPKTKKRKRTIKRDIKTKLKKRISEEKYFVLKNGIKARNVKQLADYLGYLNEDEFLHHCNAERNDFANWVETVFGDHLLAKKLRNVNNKTETVITIYEHVANNFWQ